MSRLTSPTHVRQFLLDNAKTLRHHKFTRVSQETLDKIEAVVRAHCVAVVKSAPSKGTTI